jgi:hypothetical protein
MSLSAGVASAQVNIANLSVLNTFAGQTYGIYSDNSALFVNVANVSYRASDPAGSIVDYSPTMSTIRRIADARVLGTLADSAQRQVLKYQGVKMPLFQTVNVLTDPSGGFTVGFPVTVGGDYRVLQGTMAVALRSNWNGTERAYWTGHVAVYVKLDASDAWTVTKHDIIAPSGFSVAPAVSVANAANGTGTLTLTFTPTDADARGAASFIYSLSGE